MQTLALATAVILLLPIAANLHLRNVYRQTVAHYLAKASPPPSVFIGDSIMTGGMWFDDLRNINLAANGLETHQIVKYLPHARAYSPARIVIMAGMNDAIQGTDVAKLKPLWETICAEPKIVVTLVTPSSGDAINQRIERINHMIRETCPGRPIVALDVADDGGRLRQEFSLDGIHLNARGYERWAESLQRPLVERSPGGQP